MCVKVICVGRVVMTSWENGELKRLEASLGEKEARPGKSSIASKLDLARKKIASTLGMYCTPQVPYLCISLEGQQTITTGVSPEKYFSSSNKRPVSYRPTAIMVKLLRLPTLSNHSVSLSPTSHKSSTTKDRHSGLQKGSYGRGRSRWTMDASSSSSDA